MKKFYYLLAVCALITMPFTSCSDDDDEENQLVPGKAVSNLSFTDTDTDPDKIGGPLKWDLPEPETNIDDYVIYFGDAEKEKKIKVGEVPKGTTSYIIPAGTDPHPFISVVARNSAGESNNIFSIAVINNKEEVVTDIKFEDKDNTKDKISGTVSWTAPENPPREITGYVIYLNNNDKEKGEKIGEVAAGVTTFEIPEGTDFKAKMNVVVKTVDGENDEFTSINVNDVFTKGGLYILNGGNWNENNASLSYYDLGTKEITKDIYRTQNGKGLGDGAEQLLIYGSKMYITVSGSNRLAVLDLEGKEIKSITPEGDEPMNPRCMAADNGKVYVSYYYGHSVAMLDTVSLEVEKEVKVGRYPEQLTVANGRIYVANSGGNDHPDYGETISVINQTSFEVEKEIKVAFNPVGVISDSQGDVYVISWADHGKTTDQTLQRINSKTDEVVVMGKATKMTVVDDKIYTYFSQYYNSKGISYVEYDALTESVVNDKLIADNTIIPSPNTIAVEPVTRNLFVTYFDYSSTSSMYVFGANGELLETIDTGGFDSKWMAFVSK